MKWIALHGNDVVGEFKNAKDAETYKAAADRAARHTAQTKTQSNLCLPSYHVNQIKT